MPKKPAGVRIESVGPGVTLVSEQLPHCYSFSLGLFVDCGSRDELPRPVGTTHFIEHMLFKGTGRRSSLQIVKYIERMGGSFDAFTTKESLVIVTRFLSAHARKVLDLIAEILLESQVAGRELEKEKGVILEEITSSQEDPAEHIFDLLYPLVFPGHPLAAPIAGTIATVKSIDTKTARRRYREILTRPMVIAISGNYDHEAVRSAAGRRFAGREFRSEERTAPVRTSSRTSVQNKRENAQVHLAAGQRGISLDDPRRYALLLLNTMFGGGMSSRLFQGLRETDGLVYDVNSFVDFYHDCGVLGYYLACDQRQLANVRRRCDLIFRDLRRHGFTKEELAIAKTYLSGNLMLSMESVSNRMMRLGRDMLGLGKVSTVEDVVASIQAVSRDEVNHLARAYLDPERFAVAAIGPVRRREIELLFH